ncbi:MAG: hypothetical protein HYZ74_08160 [Elusimicrobia bacterium]|nr:hypothetical protein [Elusimicrobiota bacterium]
MLAACLSVLLHAAPAAARELKVVAHVHTRASHGGAFTFDEIARGAVSAGIDSVLFADTAFARVEYGLWPLRRLLRVSRERESVLQRTPETYLAELNAVRSRYPALVLIAGAEVSPYYRWSGGPRSGLVLNDWSRHIIVAGLKDAASFRGLPMIGNGGEGDPYAAATPWEPYRAVFEYARRRGALAFWAHPEVDPATARQRLHERVWSMTDPYPEALAQAPEAAGFATLRAGLEMAKPGRQWDAALDAYCAGKRPRPPWAFAELDYRDGRGHVTLDIAYMIVEAAARTEAAVLGAIERGSFYSVSKGYATGFRLARWELRTPEGTARAGQEATTAGPVAVAAEVESVSPGARRAVLTLLRDGVVVRREERSLPASISWTDPDPGRCSHYRLVVDDSEHAQLVSNPIFSRRRQHFSNMGPP